MMGFSFRWLGILAFGMHCSVGAGQDIPHFSSADERLIPIMTDDNIPPPRFGSIIGDAAEEVQENLTMLGAAVRRMNMDGLREFLIRYQLADELILTDEQVEKINAIDTVDLTQIQESTVSSFDTSNVAPEMVTGKGLFLPKDQFKDFLGQTLQEFQKQLRASDQRLSDVLSAEQLRRLNQLRFQYYVLERPNLQRALPIYNLETDRNTTTRLQAVLTHVFSDADIAVGAVAQVLRRDVVRSVIGEQLFRSLAGSDYNFGFPVEWLESLKAKPEEHRTDRVNPRRE